MTYQVGDPDPAEALKGMPCAAQKGRFHCTLDVDHEHSQHVAGDGRTVRAVWPVR